MSLNCYLMFMYNYSFSFPKKFLCPLSSYFFELVVYISNCCAITASMVIRRNRVYSILCVTSVQRVHYL